MRMKGGGDLTAKNKGNGFAQTTSGTKIQPRVPERTNCKMIVCTGKNPDQKAGEPDQRLKPNAF